MSKFIDRTNLLYGRALEARRNPTKQEALLWAAIVKAKIQGLFVRQRVFLPNYYADLVCPERRLVIEVDGKIHEKQREYDYERDEALRIRGYTVVRFLNAEIEQDADGVVKYLQQVFNIYPRSRRLRYDVSRVPVFEEPPGPKGPYLPRKCMECRVKQRLCAKHGGR